MGSILVPSRSAGIAGRPLAVLGALVVILIAAFVLVPGPLAAIGAGGELADQPQVTDAFRAAFVQYWRSGARDFPPDLERVVDYWLRYHVAKAVIAAILLIVLVALGFLLWKAFLTTNDLGAGKRSVLAAAGGLVTALTLLSMVTVMANIQGAAAPFASLLPMLTGGEPHGGLADTLDQVRQRLAGHGGVGDRTPPGLPVMIDDFSRFHVAMAVIAAIATVLLIGVSVAFWKRYAGTDASDRPTRYVLGSYGVVSASASVALIAVVVANTTTAGDPEPALLALLNGGW